MASNSTPARFIAATVVYLLLLIILPEMALRTPQARQWFGVGSIRSGNAQFDLKAVDIDNYQRDSGAVDCLIVGASDAMADINPAGIEGYNCYNFGVGGIQLYDASAMLEVLMHKYDIKLLIVAASPSFFVWNTDSNLHITDTRWMCCYNDQPDIGGWFSHHSASYQYYDLALTALLDPDFVESRERFTEGLFRGHRRRNGRRDPAEYDSLEELAEEFRVINEDIIAEGEAYPNEGFVQRLVEWQSEGTRVVVITLPIRPDAFDQIPDAQHSYEVFQTNAPPLFRRYGLPYLNPMHALIILPDHFVDFTHMNVDGSTLLTTWVNEQLSALADP